MAGTRFYFSAVLFVLVTGTVCPAQGTAGKPLTQVYQNHDFQLTGISVSKTGRLFVNFPRWSDQYLNAVVEVMPDGSVKPYPDEHWNRWDLKPSTAGQQFVCVQSVVADGADSLYIVDAAAPLLGPTVPGGPKLVKVDLKTNKVSRVYSFDPNVAMVNSYLNDVRIDDKRQTAYMTDSGAGGIVVLDLQSGKAHRALDRNPSVMLQKGVNIVINGKPVLGEGGKPPSFNSDGIALSPDGGYLYYQALTGATMYRIKTSVLRNADASPSTVEAAVEKVAKTFPVDGMWMDEKGRLFLSGLTQNAVMQLMPDGQAKTVAKDPRLQWPDTFTEGPDGSIYISASHINESPTFNKGISVRKTPYGVFKLRP